MTTHPYAAAQPTATGKRLWPLHAHAGRIWAGYGDYSANTGPMHIMSAHPDTLAWTDHHTLQSEALYQFRTIGANLYVPSTDPRGGTSDDFATNATGAWVSHNRVVSAEHAFDMAERVPGELWITGATNDNSAVAWKRVAGVWSEALRVSPTAGYNRFYFCGVVGTSVYVQAVNSATGAATVSRVWNGTSWANGPNLLDFPNYAAGWNPTPFGTGFVMHKWGNAASLALGYYNGTTMTWGTRLCTDFAVTAAGVYALEPALGIITHSTDLVSWDVAAVAPSNALGLAVIGSTAYLGLADSTIQTVSVVHSEPATPAPTPPTPPDPPPIPDPDPTPVRRTIAVIRDITGT